eukprot:4893657-Alexandrium_andersonii.AAC.1
MCRVYCCDVLKLVCAPTLYLITCLTVAMAFGWYGFCPSFRPLCPVGPLTSPNPRGGLNGDSAGTQRVLTGDSFGLTRDSKQTQ